MVPIEPALCPVVEVVAPVVPVAPAVPAPAVPVACPAVPDAEVPEPELWAFIASNPAVANGVLNCEVGLLPCCVQ